MADKSPRQNLSDPKMFDVAKPGQLTPADATSRPVIVTNRPIMRDPMMVAPPQENEVTAPADASGGLMPSKITITPISEDQAETKPADPGTPIATDPSSQPPSEGAKATTSSDEAQDGDYDKFGDTNADAGVPDNSQVAQAAAAAEAEQKKQSELDDLVEKKQYFLPVNSVEKRRSKYEIILGLLLIIFLGLLLLNFMLDAGFVHVDGLKPFTHIFSNP